MKISDLNFLKQNKFSQFLTAKNLIYAAIFLGVVLRLIVYMNALPLWGDESSVMYSVFHRNYLGLLKPLDFVQMAPPGFLFFQRMMIDLFGRSEYSVRFLVFITSCGSLFLFYRLLRNLQINDVIILISIMLMSCSPQLISYTTYIKQYGIDVFIYLLVFSAYNPWTELEMTWKRIIWWSFVGILAVTFSYSGGFVIFAVGLYILIRHFRKKNYKELIRVFLVLTIIVLAFGLMYYFTVILNKNLAVQYQMYPVSFPFFKKGFVAFIKWCIKVYNELWYRSIGLDEFLLFTFFGLLGIIGLIKNKQTKIFLLFVPLLVAIFVSLPHIYPLYPGKFLLFVIPAVILVLATGIYSATQFFGPNLLVPMLFCLFLCLPMVYKTNYNKNFYDDIRKPMKYLSAQMQPTDTVYVFCGAQRTFEYYYPRYFSEQRTIIYGTRPWKPDIEKIKKHKRIWLVFSYLNDDYKLGGDREGMLNLLNDSGKVLKESVHDLASVHLYQFTKK